MPEWFGGAALGSGLGLAPADQWKAQWARVERWHHRVERIREKGLTNELDTFDLDEVIAYVQNCYHLRDWLEASRPALKAQLDAFFQSHFELGACRDVCNGFKHKALKRPSHDPDSNLYREYDHFLEDAEPGRNSVLYRIAFADGLDLRKFDLFAFTDTCSVDRLRCDAGGDTREAMMQSRVFTGGLASACTRRPSDAGDTGRSPFQGVTGKRSRTAGNVRR